MLVSRERDKGIVKSASVYSEDLGLQVIGNVVARDGVEPPTPAFSATSLSLPFFNNLTRQDGRFIVTIL